MPDFDDDGHGMFHGGPELGGPVPAGGPHWHGGFGPGPGWLALLVALLLIGTLLRISGYDRVLAERLRGAFGRGADHARWHAAVERYGCTAWAFATFECDPAAVLARPALADVTVPATARFVEAFVEATALRTDECPEPDVAERFIRSAERAERAWLAAVGAADRAMVIPLEQRALTTAG